MKTILAVTFFAFASISYAQQNTIANTFSITIENAGSIVSPGGLLKFKVVGSQHQQGIHDSYRFRISQSGVLADPTKYYSLYYHVTEYYDQPRFLMMRINNNISSLPITAMVEMYSGQDVYARATFYVRAGTHGHPKPVIPSGHYSRVIPVQADNEAWYEIFCISNTAGHCRLSIKNGEDNHKYNGSAKPAVYNHTCSDEGYPGGSTLDIRSPLVFNAADMIHKIDGFTAPSNHQTYENADCVFISNHPFFIRRIEGIGAQQP